MYAGSQLSAVLHSAVEAAGPIGGENATVATHVRTALRELDTETVRCPIAVPAFLAGASVSSAWSDLVLWRMCNAAFISAVQSSRAFRSQYR